MKNLIFIMLLCHGYMANAQTTINHTANRSNTSGHITTIDSKFTNGKPGAILIVNQKYGVYNANEIGVWYDAGKWKIYNQNRKALPANAIFNVLVFPKASKNVFVHTTNGSNTSQHVTTLSSSVTNGKPNSLVFVTQNYGKYNTSNVGAWYSAGKWKIYNENTIMPMPVGTKLNILVLNKGKNTIGNLTLNAFDYKNTSSGHVSTISSPATLSKTATLFSTPNYGGVYNANVTGIWLNGSKWTVFNQNKKTLPRNARFNIVNVSSGLISDRGISVPTPRAKLPKVYKKSVMLPGFSKAQSISYEIVKNKAIFQGDIVIGDSRKIGYNSPKPHPAKKDFSSFKNGFGSSSSPSISRNYRGSKGNWKWYNGVIPYQIDNKFSRNEKETILMAIDELNKKTYLTIVPYAGSGDHVRFFNDGELDFSGGYSCVGRQGGSQIIGLKNAGRGTVIHEIMHAAGFWHEQSRSDRDRYVRVVMENIKEERRYNFDKHTNDEFKLTAYDKKSIMHYDGYAFTKDSINPKPTIIDIATNKPFRRSGTISAMDIDGINQLYEEHNKNYKILPLLSSRKISIKILKITSNDSDGNAGIRDEIDFYAECELGPKWEWRPEGSTNPTETFESEVIERSGNKITPNWNFKYNIPKNEKYAKIWLKLYDEDTVSDEVIDINPFPENKAVELYVNTTNGSIYIGDLDGSQNDDNYIGQVGEELKLEGYEGTDNDIRAEITFSINLTN